MRFPANGPACSLLGRFSLIDRCLLLAALASCPGPWAAGAEAEAVEKDAFRGWTRHTTGTLTGDRWLADSGVHGGLVVHAGCDDASLAVAVARSTNVLVHGLVRDAGRLERVRREIFDAGLYGRVSAIAWEGNALPYADGMVNLLLVPHEDTGIAPSEMKRVLAPSGVAWTRHDDQLVSYRRPWPEDVDEWTHSRYDATGNAVSKDRSVGPPCHLQWEALPRWNHGVKTSSLVSARGRLFYILDDSHFAARARSWSLLARDASNGLLLWRRELDGWEGAKGGKKVGPAQVHRRLVAQGDRVYATLGERTAVSVLDAATGKLIRTLNGTGPAEEFLLSAGTLVALVNPNTPTGMRRGEGTDMRLVAVDPETGSVLWQHAATMILPLTMVADADQVVYHDGAVIKSLDLRTGSLRWTSEPTGQAIGYRNQANPDSPGAEEATIILAPQFAPTMILYDDVIAFAGGRQINVLSAEDGTELWRSDYAATNYSVPVDLFGFDGLLWGPDKEMNLWRPTDDNIDFNAYDPKTGALAKRVAGEYGFRFQHHRCHQMKVVDGTVLAGRAGVEFLDTATGDVAAHHWMRGSCFFGVLPANGRLYVPPHDCACYVRAKLSGFMALNAAGPSRPTRLADDRRLERGPAYGQVTAEEATQAGPEDWPTYRHDPSRSGRSSTSVPPEVWLGWQNEIGGRLTAPVVAGGRVYLASTDTHTLYSLDIATGETVWRATFDGRIDSPPTLHDGLVLCGTRMGSVRALRAEDGAPVWRYIARPEERLIVSRGQLESVWPVNGSVLVVHDIAYFAAGRSSYLDGGLRLYGLDPHTGEVKLEKILSSRHPDGSETLDEEGVEGYLNDILSSDGQRVFLRHQVFDLDGNPQREHVVHLHGADGYLSGDTTHRLLWTYAPKYTSLHQGAFYDMRLSRTLYPSGRILVESEDAIFGFGQNHYGRSSADPGGQWALFAASKNSDVPHDLTAREYRALALRGKQAVKYRWWKPIPIRARALVKTDDVLFVAGPPGSGTTSQDALDGRTPAMLLAIAPDDGRVLAEMALPSTPVWDGMAAASGKLFVALANGQVLCLRPVDSGLPGTPLSPAAWSAVLPPVKVCREPGLVGRWRFDEGAGMLARDCSGRGHDARVFGAWDDGRHGECLLADGNPRAAVIKDTEHLRFGNDDFTLSLWARADAWSSRLLGKESFPENWWVINVLDAGQAELVLGEGRGSGKSVRSATESSLVLGEWTHLVAAVDRHAREIRWYVNGHPSGRSTLPATMTGGLDAAGADINIPSKHKPFRGCISDLRIYRQALSAERAAELYREGTAHRAARSESHGGQPVTPN